MAIVLERREPSRDWFHDGTCRGCGSRIRFEAKDVRAGYSGMDSLLGYYADCPVCGRQFHLDRVAMPQVVIDEALARLRRREGK